MRNVKVSAFAAGARPATPTNSVDATASCDHVRVVMFLLPCRSCGISEWLEPSLPNGRHVNTRARGAHADGVARWILKL
jgi:hypothetical protein